MKQVLLMLVHVVCIPGTKYQVRKWNHVAFRQFWIEEISDVNELVISCFEQRLWYLVGRCGHMVGHSRVWFGVLLHRFAPLRGARGVCCSIALAQPSGALSF